MPATPLLPSIAFRLGQLRRAAGLTQRRLAELAGIPQRTVEGLEHGRKCEPSWGNVWRLSLALAEALNRPHYDILTELRPE
jgi:DNA-binding XRE family transcriptional regulator